MNVVASVGMSVASTASARILFLMLSRCSARSRRAMKSPQAGIEQDTPLRLYIHPP